MLAVKTSTAWTRPALFAFVWILAAALTISELSTLPFALETASAAPPASSSGFRRSAVGRTQAASRLATIP
jgi:hypothetical protein